MDDREFIAQMAQFSALEQSQLQTRAVEQQQAFSMIGKLAYAPDWFDTTVGEFRSASGLVESVSRKNGRIFLQIEGHGDVPLDNVTMVAGDQFTTAQLQGILNNTANARDVSLVGRHIQAITIDAQGNVTGFVEGVVDFIRFDGANTILMVNGQEVFPGEVFTISEESLLKGRRLEAFILNSNGTAETVEGEILGIHVSNNRAFVDVGGRRIPLERIDFLIEALQLVNTHVDRLDVSGNVKFIQLRGGMPYMYVDNGEASEFVSYADFRAAGR
jgi:flagellar hook assembly protein FlgD